MFIFLSDSIPKGADTNDLKRDLCTWFDRRYKEAEEFRSAASSAFSGLRNFESIVLSRIW